MKRKQILTAIFMLIVIVLFVPTQHLQLTEAAANLNEDTAGLRSRPDANIAQFTTLPQSPFPDASQNVFPANYFEPINARDPIRTHPFKAAEFIDLALDNISKTGDGKYQIKLCKPKSPCNEGDNAPVVSLDKYVAELNKYEEYLNGLGYTLRDGPLSHRIVRKTQYLTEDMGPILKLRNRSDVEAEIKTEKKCKPWLGCLPEFYAYDPKPFNFRDPGSTSLNPVRFKIDPANVKTFVLVPNVTAPQGVAAPTVMTATAHQTFTLESDTCPCNTKKGAVRVGIVPLGVNPATGAQQFMAFSLGGVLGSILPSVWMHSVLLGCDAFYALNGFRKPGCPKPEGRVLTGLPRPTYEEGVLSPPPINFPRSTKSPDDPACLYTTEGEMLVTWAPALEAFAHLGDEHNWFGADGDVQLNFNAAQTGEHLGIDQMGQMKFSVTVLGRTFSILEDINKARYDSTEDPRFSAGPNSFSVLGGSNYSTYIPGPEAIFMIGFVPVRVFSGVSLLVKNEDGSSIYTEIPTSCENQGSHGHMELRPGARATASLIITGRAEAIVASAGMEGALTLTDDHLYATLTTDIDPHSNDLKVTPEINYESNHLTGTLSLVMETNLLVYSKKWSVVLVDNIGGFHSKRTIKATPPTRTFFSQKKRA